MWCNTETSTHPRMRRVSRGQSAQTTARDANEHPLAMRTECSKCVKSDLVKSSILLTCIGRRREIYNTFTFDNDDDNMKFNIIIEKFDEYCSPRKNITFQRHNFFTCHQKEGQSFDQFVTELKKLSQECEFGELCNSLIRDVVFNGSLRQ